MVSKSTITKKQIKFREFLCSRGAQVLLPTSEWELIRFDCSAGVSIIYCNAKGDTKFTGAAQSAWNAFVSNGSWQAGTKQRRKKLSPLTKTLLERDGNLCFYCRWSMTDGDRSIEHLVPVAHAGPNHISNLVLAHQLCNAAAGHLSAMEKIRLRENAIGENNV
ncbi:HNH endonuclease [Eoetvoesiella caeni]|uniref:HNH endonuclease n=1 Tax=Eoetvoesiella caeni TaxID=645616 RepID=A0A366HAI5_9BURK|nr:HNH endonuclease [Eoetvoesiella caeni]MCI2809352.1 HNH endonuclease [Eoetvoesiella caeni]NYT54493.1 HNH endonuclease [Eoetvoesiella caeni]RBP39319.1 HNH endonuclease [Eoetvoesiella caeni]